MSFSPPRAQFSRPPAALAAEIEALSERLCVYRRALEAAEAAAQDARTVCEDLIAAATPSR